MLNLGNVKGRIILAYLKHLELLGVRELYFPREPSVQDELEKLQAEIFSCKRCPLHKGRKNPVLGEGNPKALLVFVGEAPGAEEDEKGRPFVGRAGELLTKIIRAMGLSRQEVYITNVVKCRPPNNRNPKPEEVKACMPYLLRQIELIRPRLICALGTVAAQSILGKQEPITSLRRHFHDWKGIKVMATFHPAFLLRNPSYKRLAWEDIRKLMAEYQALKAQVP